MSLFTSDLWLMMKMFCLLTTVNSLRMLKIDSTAKVSMPESMYSSTTRMLDDMLLL